MTPTRVFSPETPLILNPNVVRRRVGDETELWNLDTGLRFRVDAETLALLDRCAAPATLASLFPAATAGREEEVGVLRELFKRRLLVTGDEVSVAPVERGLMNLPVASPRRLAIPGAVEVGLLGVPFEQGGLTAPGARLGPDVLRRCAWSVDWRVDPDTLRVSGLYDLDEERDLFERVGMFDLGDVASAGELAQLGKPASLAAVQNVVQYVAAAGALPVLIGGDHSLTVGAVAAFDALPRMGIIQLDAHSDYSGPAAEPPTLAEVFHNNFVGYLRRMPNVAFILQLGLRAGDEPSRRHPDVRSCSLRRTLSSPIARLIPPEFSELPYYV